MTAAGSAFVSARASEVGQLEDVQLHVVAPPFVRVEKSPGNSDTASYMSLRSRQGSNLLLHLAVALSRMK
jgi:hypothetical protein